MYAYRECKYVVVTASSGRIVYGSNSAEDATQKTISFSANSGFDHIIYERVGVVKTTKITTLEMD